MRHRIVMRLTEAAFLVVCPILAFWVMQFPAISQDSFLDPYFYTGYINNFTDLFQRYGATYYAVRFGLIAPAHLTTELFGPIGGYLTLRYAYALIAGVPFYVLIRQQFGRPAAVASLSLLLTSPYFARAVLWDHPDAAGVPFSFAAICFFLIEHRRRLVLDFCAGVSAGLAVHSNIFVAAPLSVQIASCVALWLFWRRGLRAIVGRLVTLMAGVAVITALGSAYYWWRVGRADIFSATLEATLWLANGAIADWRTPGVGWVARQWHVLTPALLSVVALVAWGRRDVTFQVAAAWTGAAMSTVFVYTFQFFLGGNSLELFYYFSYLLPSVFLLVAVIVGTLWTEAESRQRWIGVVVLLTAAIGPWVAHSFGANPVLPTRFAQHLAIAGASAATVVFWRCLRAYRLPLSFLATGALGLMLVSSYSTPVYSGMVGNLQKKREMDVYQVARQLIDYVPRWDERPGALRFWYSNEPPGNSMQSVQSTYLWGHSKVQGQGRGLPYLEPSEITLLRQPDLKWLVLLAENRAQMALGREALGQVGVEHNIVDSRVLGAETYTLHVELLELVHGQ